MSGAPVHALERPDFYRDIRRNQRHAALLLGSVAAAVVVAGVIVGLAVGALLVAVVAAAVLAAALAIGTYAGGARAALVATGARPAHGPELQRYENLVAGLCIAAGLPAPRLYVVEDQGLNAFSAGRNPRHAALAVTSGMLATLNRLELEGVLAHELSHVKSYDVLPATVAVLAARPLLLAPPVAASVLRRTLGRDREVLADAAGVQLTRYPPGLASALKKLRGGRAAVRGAPRATAPLWFASPLGDPGGRSPALDLHPPLDERIRILESL